MDVSTQVDLHGGFGAPAGSISIDWDRRATPLYSREDIKEQYCITSRQLDAVEKSGGGFFGCLSTRGPSPCASARTSILSACVRSVPSDENLCDAPYPRRSLQIMYRQPYPTYSRGLSRYDFEDEADWIESSYFRRRPRSFCTVPDPKRWVSKHLIFADEIFQDAISVRAILRLRYIVVRCRSYYVLYGWGDGAEQKKIENQEPVENEIWRDFSIIVFYKNNEFVTYMFFDSRKHYARQSLNYREYRSWYTSDSITKRCLNASYTLRFICIAFCRNTFVNFHLRWTFYKKSETRHEPSGMQTRKI